MARGKQLVVIVGHMGNDPDVKDTSGGNCVATISVATTEVWNDRDGNRQERTEWHRVKYFGRTAEIVAEYGTKGMLVYVEGKLRTEKWTDQAGVDRWSTDIIGDEFQMLGGGRDRDDNQRDHDHSGQDDRRQDRQSGGGGGQQQGNRNNAQGRNNGNGNGNGGGGGGQQGNGRGNNYQQNRGNGNGNGGGNGSGYSRGNGGNNGGGRDNRSHGAPPPRQQQGGGGHDQGDDIPFDRPLHS